MAFRNRRRRYTTRKRAPVRRTRRVYRRNYKKLRRIPRGVSIQANIPRFQKLRYVQDVLLSSTSGAVSLYQFRANSIYDPDYTGAGHQPMRFDEMAKFYANYTVVGSKITIKHLGNSSGVIAQKLIVYLNDTNVTGLTYLNDLIEQGRCKYMLTSDNSSGSAQRKLSLGFSAKKFFGVTNVKDNEERIGSAVTGNPSDQALFVIGMQPIDGTSTCYSWVNVTVEYLVWFSQPLQLASS